MVTVFVYINSANYFMLQGLSSIPHSPTSGSWFAVWFGAGRVVVPRDSLPADTLVSRSCLVEAS